MDFRTSNNPLPVLRLHERPELFPSFLDDAEWAKAAAADLSHLDSSQFADPEAREFPLHCRGAIWLSAAYASGQHHFGETAKQATMGRIQEAADLFGVDLAPLLAFQGEGTKQASAAGFHALQSGQEAFYPLGTRYDVQESARGIDDDLMGLRLPCLQAKQASEALMKRAHDLNMDTTQFPESVQMLGEESWFSVEGARKVAAIRSDLTGLEDYKELADTLQVGDSAEKRAAVADLWLQLDAALGVQPTPLTPAAIPTLFRGVLARETEKMAKDTVLLRGQAVPALLVAGLPVDVLRQQYSEERATKFASIITAAGTSGLEASALCMGLSDHDQQELAGCLLRYHDADSRA